MSAEDYVELAARYGELMRGLHRLLDVLGPKPEARSLKSPNLSGRGMR